MAMTDMELLHLRRSARHMGDPLLSGLAARAFYDPAIREELSSMQVLTPLSPGDKVSRMAHDSNRQVGRVLELKPHGMALIQWSPIARSVLPVSTLTKED